MLPVVAENKHRRITETMEILAITAGACVVTAAICLFIVSVGGPRAVTAVAAFESVVALFSAIAWGLCRRRRAALEKFL